MLPYCDKCKTHHTSKESCVPKKHEWKIVELRASVKIIDGKIESHSALSLSIIEDGKCFTEYGTPIESEKLGLELCNIANVALAREE